MVWYGFLCFLGLLVTFICLVLVNGVAKFSFPTGIGILALLASVQFAQGRFVHTHRRVMLPVELKRFALACAGAFWTSDELPALIRRFLTADDHVIQNVFTVLIASAVDVAIAAVIVYATVPPIARYLVRRIAPRAATNHAADAGGPDY